MPSPLAQWMQFPKAQQPPQQEEDENAADRAIKEMWLKSRELDLFRQSRGQQPFGGLPQPYAVPSSPARPMQTMNVNAPPDEMGGQIDYMKGLQGWNPPGIPTAPPARQPLPERPQQRPQDIIPQLFSGAATIFSARSFHPYNYLADTQGMQKARRDEQYNDAVQRQLYGEQGQRQQFNDALQQRALEMQEHGRKMHEAGTLLGLMNQYRQTQIEEKYLGMTPMQQMDRQKLEAYRTQVQNMANEGEVKRWAARMSVEREEDAPIIQRVAQEHIQGIKAVPSGLELIPGMEGDPTLKSWRGKGPVERFVEPQKKSGAIEEYLRQREAEGKALPYEEWKKQRDKERGRKREGETQRYPLTETPNPWIPNYR